MGSGVNTIYDEYAPVIAPDGETLYFCRLNDPKGYGGEDIYCSKLKGLDEWGQAINAGLVLNNVDHNSVVSISPDGNAIYLHNLYGSKNVGTSVAYKTKNGWGKPQDLPIPDFYNLSGYNNGYISNDGKVHVVSLSRKDSKGCNDLYVTFLKNDGKWSELKNMGLTLNTENEESNPFIASDGTTLYFSSNGHGGYGDLDIFLSRRLDSTWTNWSMPENLGPIINSGGKENFYSVPASGDFAYFASNKDSYGNLDIFRIGLPLDKRPKPVVIVFGKAINFKTGKPIDATIHYEDLSSGKEIGTANTNPETGLYKIILPGGKKYGFRAESKGFFPVNHSLDISDLKSYKNTPIDLLLVPVEKGQVATLNNLFFEFGKSDLMKESYPELDRLTDMLTKDISLKIEISGHTDNIGAEESNRILSENRAKSVYDYLIGRGIPASRMTYKGYGSSLPVAENDNETNRAKNRRVDMKFL